MVWFGLGVNIEITIIVYFLGGKRKEKAGLKAGLINTILLFKKKTSKKNPRKVAQGCI